MKNTTDSAVAALLNTTVTVTADVVVVAQAAIANNLDQIVASLNESASAIAAATITAVGGAAAAVRSLTQAEINQLAADIRTVQNIIAELTVTVNGAAGLSASVLVVLNAEIDALQNALAPFLTPIVLLVNAIVTGTVGLTVQVNGYVFLPSLALPFCFSFLYWARVNRSSLSRIQNAIQGLQTIVTGLYLTLGL